MSTDVVAFEQYVMKEECEAALRRIVKRGPANLCINDEMMFPNPDKESDEYRYVDERDGKTKYLTRPVEAFQMRGAERSPDMGGCPAAEKDTKWAEIEAKLAERVGAETLA